RINKTLECLPAFSIALEDDMGAAVNFKLLWFLCLSLLTQAHFIHKRQADKDYQSQSLESLKPVQELLIKARQALSNDFNDLVSPPYDDVNLKHEVKLSEIKTKTKDFAISTKNDTKVQKNSGNSESEETLKPNFENSAKISGPAENHLIKAELSFANEQIEASTNQDYSENKGILTAQPVTSKLSENFLKKGNQYTESANSTTDDSLNKNQISTTKNSEKLSTLKQNPQTSYSENKLDMKTQKKQLEATNNDDKKSGSYGEIKNKNTLENSENQLKANNNSEKESSFLNTKKDDKQVEKPLNEQKPNKNDLESLVTEKVIEIENITETLPLYTPIAVTAVPNVIPKKKPMPGNSRKPPLQKPNTTAIPPKPLALASAANADRTTDTFSSTTPTAIADAKATEKPIITSATQPTRRPILFFPTRRPTPQRPRPPLGLRPPAWFTNLPLLPLNPFMSNFFINPFTSTTSRTNQTKNNVDYGILAIPWTWPFNNTTIFFPLNPILETRPLLQDESNSPTVEKRDLAFWNALFNRDYKSPGNAINKDSSEAHKTTENVNDSYWKPWKFLKFFSDNGDTNDVATVPANTQILHVYFPIKYPFKGKIVQTPAYQMEEQNLANNEETLVKDNVDPADESIKERALDATAHKSADTEAISSKKKDDKKSSVMFELEMPKPVVQLFQGFMETFMPQQN
ncbi:hypothetical protein DOY81_004544, partial [Sarcophaga bullata]